jgi:hypothetical protein
MLAIPVIVIIAVFVISLSWLIFVVSKHKKILKNIQQAIESANEKDIYAIYEALSQMAGKSSHTYIVGRTNAIAQTDGDMITLPQTLKDSPWAGQVVHINAGPQINMVINDTDAGPIQLGGRVYATIAVPSNINESGNDYVQYSPYKWLGQSDALVSAVSRLSPRYAEKLLSYLVTPGKDDFSFEPAYQVRIGEGVSWVKKPVVPVCDVCREPMSFILQCPGSLLNNRDTQYATYYLFGCKKHPDRTECVSQYQ